MSSPKEKKINNKRMHGAMGSFFRKYYVPFLFNFWTKLCILLLFIAYLSTAIWGLTKMEQGLDYDKLLLKSDPVVKTIAAEIDFFHGGDQV
jgi:hypothetical protein